MSNYSRLLSLAESDLYLKTIRVERLVFVCNSGTGELAIIPCLCHNHLLIPSHAVVVACRVGSYSMIWDIMVSCIVVFVAAAWGNVSYHILPRIALYWISCDSFQFMPP